LQDIKQERQSHEKLIITIAHEKDFLSTMLLQVLFFDGLQCYRSEYRYLTISGRNEHDTFTGTSARKEWQFYY
jgi:hypothetical protein